MSSVADKFITFLRNQATGSTPQDQEHARIVEQESQLRMAQAKKRWLIDYQQEREKKLLYIKEHLLAQNLEMSALADKIHAAKDKNVVANVDDIDMTELQNMIDEVSHEANVKAEELQKKLEDQIDSKKDNTSTEGDKEEVSDSTSNNSMIALFDKLMEKEDKELDDSVSSVRSSNSFRSMSTRKSKLTLLNKKAYAQIHVSDVFQLITSKIGNMVRSQSLMIVI